MADYFLISYEGTRAGYLPVMGYSDWSTELSMNKGNLLNISAFIDFISKEHGYYTVNIVSINRLTKEEYDFNFN